MQWSIRFLLGVVLGLMFSLCIGITYIQTYGVPVGYIEYSTGSNSVGGNNPLNTFGIVYWSFTKQWNVPDLNEGAGIRYHEPYATFWEWDREYFYRWKYYIEYGKHPNPNSGISDFWKPYLEKMGVIEESPY